MVLALHTHKMHVWCLKYVTGVYKPPDNYVFGSHQSHIQYTFRVVLYILGSMYMLGEDYVSVVDINN